MLCGNKPIACCGRHSITQLLYGASVDLAMMGSQFVEKVAALETWLVFPSPLMNRGDVDSQRSCMHFVSPTRGDRRADRQIGI